MEICDECGKSVSRLSMDYKRNKVIDKDKLLRIRKLIEQYTLLNDHNNNDNLYNPCFSTAVGLLLFALNYSERKPNKIISKPISGNSGLSRIMSWFKQSF